MAVVDFGNVFSSAVCCNDYTYIREPELLCFEYLVFIISYSVGYCVLQCWLLSCFQAEWFNACQDALNKLEQLSLGKDAAELIQSKVLQVLIFFYFGLILSGPRISFLF